MRRFLTLPLNRVFLKYMNDDHEWSIATDTRLNILTAKRGEKFHIPADTITKTINGALKNLQQHGKTPNIFLLHTHPSGGDIPSVGDISAFSYDKYRYSSKGGGLHIVGSGVITRKGILIVIDLGKASYPNNNALQENYKKRSIELAQKELIGKYGKENLITSDRPYEQHRLKPGVLDKPTMMRRSELIYKRAFREQLRENPDISTRTIKPNRRGRIHRRRGR